jgi:hypothetical protein
VLFVRFVDVLVGVVGSKVLVMGGFRSVEVSGSWILGLLWVLGAEWELDDLRKSFINATG